MTNDPLKVAIEALTNIHKAAYDHEATEGTDFIYSEAGQALKDISALTAHQELPKCESSDADKVDAQRYRVLRDAKYQLDEDDISVADSFFNVFFDEELDKAVDALKARYDAIASATADKENKNG